MAADTDGGGEIGLVERFTLKAFVEAAMLVDEDVAGAKDVDLGMMMGAGIMPGPLARADQAGLDTILERLELAEREFGDRFAAPAVVHRLVAQGRLGAKSGQGFFPYPAEDAEALDTVKIERRGEITILWLDQPPMNQISPQAVADLTTAWEQIEADGQTRAVVITSSTTMVFCAGADIKAFTKMDADSGRELLRDAHAIMRRMETSPITTIAAVNSMALGGGCELAMACDFRVAARGASFGQPEIDLGIIPGFGGTQRLPRLVGEAKALEMNLLGGAGRISADQAYAHGLANEVVPDHELFDTALSWATKLAGQAPVATAQIKQASAAPGTLDDALETEAEAFATVFATEDATEGIGAFLGKRDPEWKGR